MRTLNLNKRPIWHIEYLGEVPILDNEGLDTGEVEKQYSEPKALRLNLYTSTSEIIQNMFGMTNNINIICSDESVKLKKGAKLFYNKPNGDTDFERDFDLEVTAISKSLNHWNYGFREVR